MKKSIPAGASILALSVAAPAFAQIVTTVTNSSNIDQIGSNNTAAATQAGANTSNIIQTGTVDGFGNSAEVLQSGNGNKSNLAQTGSLNSASVTQSSHNNLSNVSQTGTGSSVTVTQGF